MCHQEARPPEGAALAFWTKVSRRWLSGRGSRTFIAAILITQAPMAIYELSNSSAPFADSPAFTARDIFLQLSRHTLFGERCRPFGTLFCDLPFRQQPEMLGHVVWRAILNPELMGSISNAVFKVGHRVLSFVQPSYGAPRCLLHSINTAIPRKYSTALSEFGSSWTFRLPSDVHQTEPRSSARAWLLQPQECSTQVRRSWMTVQRAQGARLRVPAAVQFGGRSPELSTASLITAVAATGGASGKSETMKLANAALITISSQIWKSRRPIPLVCRFRGKLSMREIKSPVHRQAWCSSSRTAAGPACGCATGRNVTAQAVR